MSITTEAPAKPRRVKDTEELVSGVRRQHKALANRAMGEDPWVAAEMIKAAAELEEAAVRVIAHLRGLGYTWHDIGLEFGLSDAVVCKRYAKRVKAINETTEEQQ